MGWAYRQGGLTQFCYKTERTIDLKDRRGTAFHEAGHTVIALALGIEVEWATVVPTDGGITCGRFKWHPEKHPRQKTDMVLLAAAWAESIAHNPPHFPRTVQTLGTDLPSGSNPFKYDIWARKLVRKYQIEIERVAEALLIRKRMTGYEIRCVAGFPA